MSGATSEWRSGEVGKIARKHAAPYGAGAPTEPGFVGCPFSRNRALRWSGSGVVVSEIYSALSYIYELATSVGGQTRQLQSDRTMDFNNIDDIKRAGFAGFKTMQQLFADSSQLPPIKGVYLVLNLEKKIPAFREVGSGGHFKGKNPNVAVEELRRNWIDKALVVYIGKAGSDNGSATLKSRLRQYFGFGQGKNIGHWGGRLIWQLASSSNLVVCWKPLPNENPRKYEQQLIKDFVTQFGNRPFANLAD